jgi:di/tripeptidase
MEAHFARIFDAARERGVNLSVKRIGERPCMGKIDPAKIAALTEICRPIIEKHAAVKVRARSSSTDCNIPLSLGISSVCVGTYLGAGAHTREEKLLKSSVMKGLNIVADTIFENI